MWKLALLILLSSGCIAQESQVKSDVLKVENCTKGELTIKVAPFGLGSNDITVGTVTTYGVINFDWLEIGIKAIVGGEFYMSKIERGMSMIFCNNKQIDTLSETIKVAPIEEGSSYKKGKYIGSLYPVPEKEMQDNTSLNRYTSLVLGSSLSWNNNNKIFKAKCSVNFRSENNHNFKEVTACDIELKKG